MALEGDYVIERLWKNAVPGRSSAPSHVTGGVAYTRYQLTPKLALAARAEYLSDRGGLFSGLNQALKETTATFDYLLGEGFLMRYEWRRDFSNQPTFLIHRQGVLSKAETTATAGLIWWWGRKEGSWCARLRILGPACARSSRLDSRPAEFANQNELVRTGQR